VTVTPVIIVDLPQTIEDVIVMKTIVDVEMIVMTTTADEGMIVTMIIAEEDFEVVRIVVPQEILTAVGVGVAVVLEVLTSTDVGVARHLLGGIEMIIEEEDAEVMMITEAGAEVQVETEVVGTVTRITAMDQRKVIVERGRIVEMLGAINKFLSRYFDSLFLVIFS